MNALDKITGEILARAAAQADEILCGANQKAAEILEKGQADREEWSRRFSETAERECLEIQKRAESADRQNRRRALLEVRNRVIDEVISEAKAGLARQPGQERFKIIRQGNILLNNSVDAVFEAENQTLRDRAYEVLTADS